MLNLNSPTVQAMMKSSPNGFGNMPVYYGNTPQIQTETIQPQQQQFQSPYPSPKEMLTQQGQQTIYQQTSFTPNPVPYPPNVVGMAHPGYNPNPYLNYAQNPTAYYQYQNPYAYRQYVPMDDETKIILETASNNGLTYEEQVHTESRINKLMSRIVSNNLGRSEEEALECESRFNVIDKDEEKKKAFEEQKEIYREIYKKNRVVIKVSVTCGDEVIASRDSDDNVDFKNDMLESNVIRIEQAEKVKAVREANRERAFQIMHNQAIERKYDDTDLFEFFNGGGASEVTLSIQQQKLKDFNSTLIGKTYDKNNFRNRLLKNNRRSSNEIKAVEKYVGRYGILPNGMPVSPQHPPEIAESFSYNPNTGYVDIVVPNYMTKAFDGARYRFFKSLDNTE